MARVPLGQPLIDPRVAQVGDEAGAQVMRVELDGQSATAPLLEC